MKADTQSFYETAVRKAVARIVTGLDEALDLRELARTAALSTFHFHRLFRGMVGETPLAMHRRLRLERAAWRLAEGNGTVTAIALDSGYNTHESFTRAFNDHYGMAPSDFRVRAKASADSCARPSPFRLAAANGVHFEAAPSAIPRVIDSETIAVVIATTRGVPMDVSIEQRPAFRLAAIRHIGPYAQISEAFQRLDEIARSKGLLNQPQAAMVAVYYDDPESTPADQLRSDAAIAIPDHLELPAGLSEVRLPAGPYARTTHIGPYQGLGDTWARLLGEWLPKSGQRVAEAGLSYELYRNTPMTAAAQDLRTELYLPLRTEA